MLQHRQSDVIVISHCFLFPYHITRASATWTCLTRTIVHRYSPDIPHDFPLKNAEQMVRGHILSATCLFPL